jgi:imidazolonepropionase-like amidohydrolase
MAGNWAAPTQAAEKTVAYVNAVVIDGAGVASKSVSTILTRGDRIVSLASAAPAVRPADPPDAPLDADETIDLQGQYVIPGLVNTHVHLATQPNRRLAEAYLRRDVYGGITEVRDMAGDARALADLSRSALLGDIPSPDIYYSALMAGPDFFVDPRTHAAAQGAIAGDVPWLRAVTPETDLRLAVAEARGTGATGIKIYADLPAPLVGAVTAEAHRQHMLVWAHAAVFPASPREVVDAGVDVVSHVCMLAYQASASMPPAYHHRAAVEADKFAGDNPRFDALLADMKRRGTILDATLWVYEEMAREHAAESQSPAPYCSAELAANLLNRAYRAGIPIATGTDGFAPWASPWPALQDEIALLVHKAGMTPADAIRAATRTGARTIGQDHDMGSIEPGKRADFVVLAKDPLADIDNLKSVTLTVKRGIRYPRSDYRPITADEAKGEL